jgi:5-formyltetrahydrofolate cyclo-ligase
MIITQDKSLLRTRLKQVRSRVPPQRRSEATTRLFSDLIDRLKDFQSILSFASKGDEIDLWQLNRKLANETRLLLPKVSGEHLDIYAIDNLEEQLAPSSWSILEPIPERCRKISLETIECILVPGLGFDSEKRRIGYGKGHYDRLLREAKKVAPSVLALGVAYAEQLVSEEIPLEDHDFLVDQLLIY